MKTLPCNLTFLRAHLPVVCTAFLLAPAGNALADISARFDGGNGTLSLTAPAGAEIRCTQDARGFLTLRGEGWERSSDPSSAHYDPALRDVSAAKLHGVKMENGSRLIVEDLSAEGELAIEASRLTLTGKLHTRALRLRLAEQLVTEPTAHVRAQADGSGGEITCDAPVVITGGTFDASGERGGAVRFSAGNMYQYGRLQANGTRDGGTVTVHYSGKYTEAESARVSTRSENGRGGRITYNGEKGAVLFTSGTLEATGQEGGSVHVLGSGLKLAAARIDASGSYGGGEVLIGGDKQGANPGISNACEVNVNPSTSVVADARVSGPGGKIVVWSDGRTEAAGQLSARGGEQGGNGGFIEASGKGELAYGARADAAAPRGKPGTLLLDPKFIEIKTAAGGGSIGFSELVDPHPTPTGSNFGVRVQPLSTGNVVVTDPGDDTNGTSSGAIYLYNGKTGALVSTLLGAAAGDALGGVDQSGFYTGADIINLGANAYVISQDANGKRGALTYVNGTTGVSGTVGTANSIMAVTTHTGGFDPGEFPANSFAGQPPYATKLSNGNYVLAAPGYNGRRGFAMLLDGATGLPPAAVAVAQPSASNSIIGTNANDSTGHLVTDLKNGHYLVRSISWSGGPANSGAVTFCDSATATVGVVAKANSMVGPTVNDNFGGQIFVLPNHNYLLYSAQFGQGGGFGTPKGALTLCVGTTGRPPVGLQDGSVDATNTYMGNAGDQLGASSLGGGSVLILSTGKYVIASPFWGTNRGAVAVGDPNTGLVGLAGPANSLVGHTSGNGSTTFGDNVGSGSNFGLGSAVIEVGDGNIVISSPNFSGFRGAATFMSGNAPLLGDVISTSNSLVGTTGVTPGQPDASNTGDRVSLGGVFSSQTSSYYNGSSTVSTTYTIASKNYVVCSPVWSGGGDGGFSLNGKGAATWGSGSTGVVGNISSANSLVGATSGPGVGDAVGSISGLTVLANGNYVIRARGFNGTRGAITWCNGATGTNGVVDATNSLVGTTQFQSIADGNNPLIALTNGNYVCGIPNLTVGGNTSAGALVWGNGATAGSHLVGTIDTVNKITGVSASDNIGQNLKALSNGNCWGQASNFNNGGATGAGAVTWVNGTNGRDVTGGFNPVSATNSLVGGSQNDNVGSGYQGGYALPSGNFLISSPNWDGGATDAGAVTFCKSDGTTVGVVGSGNSLVGSHASDKIGNNSTVVILPNGNYVIGTNSWNTYAGHVTWGSGTTGVKGVIDASNSIIGSQGGNTTQDQVGNFSIATPGNGNPINDNPRILASGDFVLVTANFHSGANTVGAGTWVSGTTGKTSNNAGTISAANSVMGAGTFGGASYAVEDIYNGNVLVGFNQEANGKVRLLTGTGPGSLIYSSQPTATVTVDPSFIANAIGGGTNLILQANTDLTVTDAINVTGTGAGTLTLQAGRSILINANITTNNGILNLTANDVLAAGVIDAQRDAGAGVLTLAVGKTIDTGTAPLNARVLDGAGKTNLTSGPMTLDTIKSNGGVLSNTGPTAGSNISVTSLQMTGDMTATAPTVTLRTLNLASRKLTVSGNLAFAASGQLTTQISGTGAGQLGQVGVTGTVNLNSAVLDASLLGGYTPADNTVHKIVDNDLSDAITGTFSGLAENAATNISGLGFTVKYTDGNGLGNDAVLVKTPPVFADLSITKTDGVTTATPGGSVTYTITASNAGPNDVIGATLADTFPASLTCTWTAVGAGGGVPPATSGSGNINAAVNLPAGGSVTYTVNAAISAAATGSLSNTATIAVPAGITDPNPGNNSATDTDTLTPSADLSITKTDGVTTAQPGGSVTYTITASNAGPSNAPGATVADTFPASLTCTWTAVGAGGGVPPATSGSGNINAAVNLPAGGSVTYTVSATISGSASGTLSNTATVAAPAGVTDPNPGNNSATDNDTLVLNADLALDVTATPTTAPKGSIVSFALALSNLGPADAANPSVSFPTTANMVFVSATAPGGWNILNPAVGASGTVTFTRSTLANGGSAAFTVVTQVGASVPTGTVINNTATASSSNPDPVSGNNSDTDPVSVGTLTPTPAQVGTTGVLNRQTGLFELTVNVTNTTPLPINGFRVHVDYASYIAAYPSLRLYNATSLTPDPYVDYAYPVAVDATVPVKLLFYTSTRTFPNPFNPGLTVEILPVSAVAGPPGPGVQPRIVKLANGTVLLEFDSIPGHWYRVRYSATMAPNSWYDCPVPIQANANRTQWIDDGAPFTSISPADPSVTTRFYLVNEVP
ncbi:DUF11 domain-containing protein [Luteolibacter ambystomatis]|uniref:DUF11 domain-containing protein n=1 Tax=Luteolibacter ambystomatis TaxID=2824561 RepID=A0A975J2L9_9BACT|nr:DUF11 domain-containing protein [Luteolibacter ambystomatis]QUE52878.1 DUF11 domain-containing protein [Luteolibacter ambystomatis]